MTLLPDIPLPLNLYAQFSVRQHSRHAEQDQADDRIEQRVPYIPFQYLQSLKRGDTVDKLVYPLYGSTNDKEEYHRNSAGKFLFNEQCPCQDDRQKSYQDNKRPYQEDDKRKIYQICPLQSSLYKQSGYFLPRPQRDPLPLRSSGPPPRCLCRPPSLIRRIRSI